MLCLGNHQPELHSKLSCGLQLISLSACSRSVQEQSDESNNTLYGTVIGENVDAMLGYQLLGLQICCKQKS